MNLLRFWVALALVAGCEYSPPETRELDWQTGAGFPEAKWLFPVADGRVCAANDGKFTVGSVAISGGYVVCSAGDAKRWEAVVADDGTALTAYPSIAARWAFHRPAGTVQFRTQGVATGVPRKAGLRAYTGSGKQLVGSVGNWRLVSDDGGERALEDVPSGGDLVATGINDEVILRTPAGALLVVNNGQSRTILAQGAATARVIGQSEDGTVFVATLAPDGMMTFSKSAAASTQPISQPPFAIDHRYHQQCGVSLRGDLLCLMYFNEVIDPNTGEGWVGHYELLRLDGATWQRLGKGPPGSSGVNTSFVVAVDDRRHVFVKSTEQFGIAYSWSY
jgi:hypothetical protein